MDNLPKDPPDQNNNPPNPEGVTLPQTPVSEPPNPSNNTVDPVQSWVAQHEARDSSGKFVKSDHLTNGQTTHSPNHSAPSSPSTLPSPIQVTQNNKYSERNDPPMVDLKVTNPVTYLKKWVTKFFKNQDIDLHLRIKPFATIGLVIAFSVVSGASYTWGFNSAISKFFPNSSPILHRSISLSGIIQRSETGEYYLSLPDNSLWTLKPKNNNIYLINYINKSVVVKGNLTAEPNVIEVSEVISFDKPTPVYSNPTPATSSGQPIP